MRSLRTPLILILLAVLVGGASYYTTDVRQQDELAQLRDSRRAAELLTARVEDLLVQESVSDEAAAAALSRWHTRYKYIPTEMVTADVIDYVRGLTKNGFDAFNMRRTGNPETPDYSKHMFDVQGVGEYEELYHVVWHLENNREFYRVHDLRMEYVNEAFGAGDDGPLRDLVRFSFQLESFYGGIDGISAPEEDLAPVPTGLLLPHTASRDIFAPIVRIPKDAPSTSVAAPETGDRTDPGVRSDPPVQPPQPGQQLPSNRPPEGLDIERATLKLIIGGQAQFEDAFGRSFTVKVGDEVIGGEIETVNASEGLVRARIEVDGNERLVVRTLGDRPAE